jgi:DASS family divalent anion:Na+ symporter
MPPASVLSTQPGVTRRSDRWRRAAPLVVGGAIWLLPHAGFSPQRWGLLCLFGATVCALITRPLPSGAAVLVAITCGVLLGLFTIQDALSGFANVTVWLIVSAFLFARAFATSRRISGEPGPPRA